MMNFISLAIHKKRVKIVEGTGRVMGRLHMDKRGKSRWLVQLDSAPNLFGGIPVLYAVRTIDLEVVK